MTQTVLLVDVADINPESVGKSYGYTEILYLDTSSVTKNTFSELQPFTISDAPSRARRVVRDGDIVYSTVRPNLKHFGYIRDPAENTVASTGFAVIRAREGIDSKYLYYWLASDERTEYLSAVADSQTSTFPAFNPSVLGRLKIELPDIETQKKIADILGSIDEKIELNRQINETLEQMGQALFRHYFIDNPEAEKWEEKTLDDIIDLRGGLSYKASYLSEDGSDMPMVTMGCVSPNSRINMSALKRYSGDYKAQHLLDVDDIFIATRDVTQDRVLIGSPAIVPKSLGQAICATNLYKVIKKSDISTEFLYQLLRTDKYREQIIANAKGSTIVMLTRDSVLRYKFKTDFESEAYASYLTKSEPVRQMIDINAEQIQTLTTLRDTLLPRLISGKVKV